MIPHPGFGCCQNCPVYSTEAKGEIVEMVRVRVIEMEMGMGTIMGMGMSAVMED